MNVKKNARLFAVAIGVAAALCFTEARRAADVTPFKPGDRVDTQVAKALLERYDARPIQPWVVQEQRDLPTGARGELIKYGIEILTHTSRVIGPNAPIRSHRYSGNNLNCINCHQVGPSGLPGAKPFALPYVNVANDYPKLNIRTMRIVSLEDRILQMCGKGAVPMVEDSREMKAIVAYMTWLDSKAKPNMRMGGTGLQQVLTTAARGESAYRQASL